MRRQLLNEFNASKRKKGDFLKRELRFLKNRVFGSFKVMARNFSEDALHQAE